MRFAADDDLRSAVQNLNSGVESNQKRTSTNFLKTNGLSRIQRQGLMGGHQETLDFHAERTGPLAVPAAFGAY